MPGETKENLLEGNRAFTKLQHGIPTKQLSSFLNHLVSSIQSYKASSPQNITRTRGVSEDALFES